MGAQQWRKMTDEEKESEIKERFEKFKHLEDVNLAFIVEYEKKPKPGKKKKKKNRDIEKEQVVCMDELEDDLIGREKERLRIEEEEERKRIEEEERKKQEEEKRKQEEEKRRQEEA